jgi:hypothetical protein
MDIVALTKGLKRDQIQAGLIWFIDQSEDVQADVFQIAHRQKINRSLANSQGEIDLAKFILGLTKKKFMMTQGIKRKSDSDKEEKIEESKKITEYRIEFVRHQHRVKQSKKFALLEKNFQLLRKLRQEKLSFGEIRLYFKNFLQADISAQYIRISYNNLKKLAELED